MPYVNLRLSTNFTLDELTDSANHPDLVPGNRAEIASKPELIKNITDLAVHVLQPLHDALSKHFGKTVSVFVSSGYRGTVLNVKVGGSPTGAHPRGHGADINVHEFSVDDLFQFIKDNLNIFNGWLDKCIIEKVGDKEWIHISADIPENARCEFYTTNDGKKYDLVYKGLVAKK
jgi:phenylpyruvate tautomerase PptA (4-oxalocrotonate tautomerase family)